MKLYGLSVCTVYSGTTCPERRRALPSLSYLSSLGFMDVHTYELWTRMNRPAMVHRTGPSVCPVGQIPKGSRDTRIHQSTWYTDVT